MTRDEAVKNLIDLTDRYPMDVGQDGDFSQGYADERSQPVGLLVKDRIALRPAGLANIQQRQQ